MDRLWRTDCEGVHVLVLHFSPENGREGAQIPRTHTFSPSQIRIQNERGMFGNKRRESERVERHQRVRVPRFFFFFFFRLGRRAFLQLALVWLSVKVEGKMPVE